MSMKITFLGTGGSVPTTKRGLPAILVQRESDQLLFDCGEGVQRQMIKAKCGFNRISKVFISHMHGDHVLGLPGLMQTMAMLNREKKLDVYGPPDLESFLECVRSTLQFGLTFPVEIHTVEGKGTICNEKEFTISTAPSKHVITSLAYGFIEKSRVGRFHPERAKALGVPEGPLWSKLQQGQKVKSSKGKWVEPEEIIDESRLGRKIVYTGDTRPFDELTALAENADVLIHDSTLDDDLIERSEEDGHSTPSQAAKSAKKAKVKQLILTHISARYDDTTKLLEHAQKIFKNTIVAEDFMKIEVSLPK